jgi:hypothetical protein
MQTPISYFTELTDPRVERSKAHLMEDIIFITKNTEVTLKFVTIMEIY